MSYIDSYQSRLESRGADKRERILQRAKNNFVRKASSSPAYVSAEIDGNAKNILLISSEDAFTKKIVIMPGDVIYSGSIVKIFNNNDSYSTWLVTDVNIEDSLSMVALAQRCNYLLKWNDENGTLIERHCIIADGTKYMPGEDFKDQVTVGNSRMALWISHDNDTIKLKRGARFLLDNTDDDPMCYELTKPNRVSNVYDGHGFYKHILSECARASDEVDNYSEKIIGEYDYSYTSPTAEGEWL